MKEEAGHVDPIVQSRAAGNLAAADRSADRTGEDGSPSLQGSRHPPRGYNRARRSAPLKPGVGHPRPPRIIKSSENATRTLPMDKEGAEKIRARPQKPRTANAGQCAPPGGYPDSDPSVNGAYMPGSTVIEMVAAHFFP